LTSFVDWSLHFLSWWEFDLEIVRGMREKIFITFNLIAMGIYERRKRLILIWCAFKDFKAFYFLNKAFLDIEKSFEIISN
jgi:hypothetical protein